MGKYIMRVEQENADRASAQRAVVVGGLLLLGAILIITVLSKQFVFGLGHLKRPIISFIAIYLVAWGGYALAVFHGNALAINKRLFTFVVWVAILVRLLLIFSNPILENDFYRYIWDGKVLESGRNPFHAAPAEMDIADIEPDEGRRPRAALVHRRINYPDVKTIYPPLAQLVFLLNASLFGWEPGGFRLTFLILDLLIMVAIYWLTGDPGRRRACFLVYAWNPLLLKETINSMHIDIACALFLTAYVAAVIKGRPALAFAALLPAVFVKITPVVLLAPLSFYLIHTRRWGRLLVYNAVFLLVALALVWTMGFGVREPFSGLLEFAHEWEMNSSLFALVQGLLKMAGVANDPAAALAKWMLAGCFGTFILVSGFVVRSREQLLHISLWALMLVFLIAPTGNPWYLTWLLPFLMVTRHPVVLALMIVTSLYYFNFVIIDRELGNTSYTIQQWAEYLPFYLFLGWYAWWRHGAR